MANFLILFVIYFFLKQNSIAGVAVGGSISNMVLFNQVKTREKSCSFENSYTRCTIRVFGFCVIMFKKIFFHLEKQLPFENKYLYIFKQLIFSCLYNIKKKIILFQNVCIYRSFNNVIFWWNNDKSYTLIKIKRRTFWFYNKDNCFLWICNI